MKSTIKRYTSTIPAPSLFFYCGKTISSLLWQFLYCYDGKFFYKSWNHQILPKKLISEWVLLPFNWKLFPISIWKIAIANRIFCHNKKNGTELALALAFHFFSGLHLPLLAITWLTTWDIQFSLKVFQ